MRHSAVRIIAADPRSPDSLLETLTWTAADDDGGFTLGPLRGPLHLGTEGLGDEAYVARVRVGERDVTGQALEALTWASAPISLELSVEGVRLEGLVKGVGGSAESCSYVVLPAEERDWSAISTGWAYGDCEAEGRFLSRLLPPGDYITLASDTVALGAQPDIVLHAEFHSLIRRHAKRVRLHGARTTTEVPVVGSSLIRALLR